MRRRRPISVWPAVADLMTVLAVTGLFGALTLLPHAREKGELVQELERAEQRLAELERDLDERREELAAQQDRHKREKDRLESRLREAARNREMFKAIQRVQEVVDEISTDQTLRFEEDQTLRFGDDLVRFELNGIEPEWRPEGRTKLRRFCKTLSERLADRSESGAPLRDLFTVHVEGHTDTTRCPEDPNCNWWISAGRAASFVALMRNEEYCPGGEDLHLRPVGFADSHPPGGDQSASRERRRRIAVRLAPDYRSIIGDGTRHRTQLGESNGAD